MFARITPQFYSGRANPSWEVEGADLSALLERVSAAPGMAVPLDRSGHGRLGYSGVLVELGSDHLSPDLPSSFLLDASGTGRSREGASLAADLIRSMPDSAVDASLTDDTDRFAAELRDIILEDMADVHAAAMGELLSTMGEGSVNALPEAGEAADIDRGCIVESAVYNPGFWNDNAGPYQRSNNCYCYAANRRINKFGYPGKAAGRPVGFPYTLANVRDAMLADGMKLHGNCLPETERPRFFVAMVVAEYNGVQYHNDFHFYRHSVTDTSNTNKFWSHKQGQFPVTDCDNSNRVIRNVETCNRGKYNLFGGYFYVGKSVRIDGNPPPR